MKAKIAAFWQRMWPLIKAHTNTLFCHLTSQGRFFEGHFTWSGDSLVLRLTSYDDINETYIFTIREELEVSAQISDSNGQITNMPADDMNRWIDDLCIAEWSGIPVHILHLENRSEVARIMTSPKLRECLQNLEWLLLRGQSSLVTASLEELRGEYLCSFHKGLTDSYALHIEPLPSQKGEPQIAVSRGIFVDLFFNKKGEYIFGEMVYVQPRIANSISCTERRVIEEHEAQSLVNDIRNSNTLSSAEDLPFENAIPNINSRLDRIALVGEDTQGTVTIPQIASTPLSCRILRKDNGSGLKTHITIYVPAADDSHPKVDRRLSLLLDDQGHVQPSFCFFVREGDISQLEFVEISPHYVRALVESVCVYFKSSQQR